MQKLIPWNFPKLVILYLGECFLGGVCGVPMLWVRARTEDALNCFWGAVRTSSWIVLFLGSPIEKFHEIRYDLLICSANIYAKYTQKKIVNGFHCPQTVISAILIRNLDFMNNRRDFGYHVIKTPSILGQISDPYTNTSTATPSSKTILIVFRTRPDFAA